MLPTKDGHVLRVSGKVTVTTKSSAPTHVRQPHCPRFYNPLTVFAGTYIIHTSTMLTAAQCVQHNLVTRGSLPQNPVLWQPKHRLQGCFECRALKSKSKSSAQKGGKQARGECLLVEVNPDGSDAWRLEEVADIIRAGGVRAESPGKHYLFMADPENVYCCLYRNIISYIL